ncbi:hypothetical protein [Aurantibacillus circumpalustris]|uniref:hypothetical protein n=1 Tax=Aurantibacillus circumpalustris TaxID=3036359 RepID=UPI00295B800C|nr:hypothetical protein [Aurantibacillus circumpalustris]
MKTRINLLVALLILIGFSCKKDTIENKLATPIDFRDKYLGMYNCQVKSSNTFYDAMNNPYKKDSTYTVVMEVKKSDAATGLKMTNSTTSETIFEVNFDTEPNFSATRIQGYFFKTDSLYINNSHPSLIYSNIYSGKKIN